MNGYIHSPEGVLFTCRFLARLVYNYTKIADTFKDYLYSKILTTTLRQFANEDSQKYGCLLELRDALTTLSPNTQLTSVQVALLYAYDFTKLRISDETDIVESLILSPPGEQEIANIMN